MHFFFPEIHHEICHEHCTQIPLFLSHFNGIQKKGNKDLVSTSFRTKSKSKFKTLFLVKFCQTFNLETHSGKLILKDGKYFHQIYAQWTPKITLPHSELKFVPQVKHISETQVQHKEEIQIAELWQQKKDIPVEERDLCLHLSAGSISELMVA